VTDIDSNEHGLLRNLGSKRHSPEVTAKLGIHLANDVQEDPVIVLLDGAVGHELGNDGTVTVDLVFQEGVEVLVICVVGHDHQEQEIRMLDGAIGLLNSWQHLLNVVVLDTLRKGI
jgi:hypothetical protein